MRAFLVALWTLCCTPTVILPVAGATMTACGPSQRTIALRASLTTVNAARDGFLVYDRDKQTDIVHDAKTKEEGRANLDAYRKARVPVVVSLETAYRLIATASLSTGLDILTVARAVEAVSSAIVKLKETF